MNSTDEFTSVLIKDTIKILVDLDKNWLNKSYNSQLSKDDLTQLLRIATNYQISNLTTSCSNRWMVSLRDFPFGPLLANVIRLQMNLKGIGGFIFILYQNLFVFITKSRQVSIMWLMSIFGKLVCGTDTNLVALVSEVIYKVVISSHMIMLKIKLNL
ncbi:hypothetical protein GQR58_028700 [Nymphon striatum]|nr:hypothetical protein GQR58_028700 [Nymphon striatum]